MIGWTIINILSGILVAMVVTFKLIAYPDRFTVGERIGMGVTAAGMLMSIGPILEKSLLFSHSPFDDWSVTMIHIGLAIYFLSRLARHWAKFNGRADADLWFGSPK